jgi:hypothetical protein
MRPNLEAAHEHCFKSRKEILANEICGCFCCLATFPPAEIDQWMDDFQTPILPQCGIDSVIGSASGFSIDDKFFVWTLNLFRSYLVAQEPNFMTRWARLDCAWKHF